MKLTRDGLRQIVAELKGVEKVEVIDDTWIGDPVYEVVAIQVYMRCKVDLVVNATTTFAELCRKLGV